MVFHVVYGVQKMHEAPLLRHPEEAQRISPVVFLPDRTGRNIFLGHGKGGAVVQNQSLETTACHGAPVH